MGDSGPPPFVGHLSEASSHAIWINRRLHLLRSPLFSPPSFTTHLQECALLEPALKTLVPNADQRKTPDYHPTQYHSCLLLISCVSSVIASHPVANIFCSDSGGDVNER